MRFIATTVLCVLFSSLTAQDISTKKLYAKILFEELDVRNEDGRVFSKSILLHKLFAIDTIINCFGDFDSKSTDLFYTSDIKIQRVPYQIKCEKATSENIFNVYKLNVNPESGEFSSKDFLFNFRSDNIHNVEIASSRHGAKRINSILDNWKIEGISNKSINIEIDSCMLGYSLRLFDGNKFKHSYQSKLNCGKINNEDSEHLHALSYLEGFWKIREEQLIFVNPDFEQLELWNFKVDNNTLTLKRGDYLITLIKY